jgi:hypothetical protein
MEICDQPHSLKIAPAPSSFIATINLRSPDGGDKSIQRKW